jgi:hypothetical protein
VVNEQEGDIKARKVYKWKARLNGGKGKKELRMKHSETYAPVVPRTYVEMYSTI